MASNNRREPQTHHTEAEAEADAENEAENESEAENENENENETTVVKKQPTTTTTPKKTSGEQEQEEEEEEEEGKPELIIYTLDRDHKTYSMSLFATKLHLRLRHGGIRYENAMGNRGDAPKEKFPYVRFVGGGDHDDDGGDGDDDGDGRFMGDSALIVERLVKRGKLEDLMMGSGVSEEIRAMDLCLRVLVEDRLYYLINYERWYGNYNAMRDKLFGHLPSLGCRVAGFFTFQYLRLMLYFQGTGRHQPEEVRHFTEEVIGAVAGLAKSAQEKAGNESSAPFWILGGEKPTEADFTLFGALAGYLVTPTQPDTTALIKTHPALVDYIERIHGTYFPDYTHLPCEVASWPTGV